MLNEDGSNYSCPEMVGNVPVVQAYAYSKYLGNIEVTFDDDGNVISAERSDFAGCFNCARWKK